MCLCVCVCGRSKQTNTKAEYLRWRQVAQHQWEHVRDSGPFYLSSGHALSGGASQSILTGLFYTGAPGSQRRRADWWKSYSGADTSTLTCHSRKVSCGLKDFYFFSFSFFLSITGVAGRNRPGVFLFNAASGGLPSQEVTFAKIAKQQGYETALIGTLQLSLISQVKG